jgi:hypothetical protein
MAEMRATNPVMENLLPNSINRHFALCESCFWSATILKMKEYIACPTCADSIVSLIPLTTNESYRLKLSQASGLEISFSTLPKLKTLA